VKPKLVVATALGLLTAGALYAYTVAVRREAEGGERVQALVTLRPLGAGQNVGKRDVGLRSVPASYLHPDAVTGEEAERAVGRTAATELQAGQIVLGRDLGEGGPPRKPLAEIVPKGQRALTLPVDVSSSLGGALREGDRVDLLGTFTRAGDHDRATVTLLQDVAVLRTGPGDTTLGHITVALGLEEAELVTFALSRGQVQVVLRHARDRTVLEHVPDKTFADIFEVERRAALVRRRRTIEQIREPEP